MKRDLCDIAGIVNDDPKRFASPIESHAAKHGYSLFQAGMDVFCRAKKVVDEAKGQNPRLVDYAVMFSTQHFFKSFDLIFSNASELRFVANGLAHTLFRQRAFNLDALIRTSCPHNEKRIAKVVLSAFETFCPMQDRVGLQSIEEAKQTIDFEARRPTTEQNRWAKLSDWLDYVLDGGAKAGTAKISAVGDDADDEQDDEDNLVDAGENNGENSGEKDGAIVIAHK